MTDFVEMTQSKSILLACAVGVILGALLGGFIILTIEDARSEIVQQKFLSLRYRVAEILPQPTQPAFVPTARATLAPIIEPSPTIQRSSPPTAIAQPTPRPTRTRAPIANAPSVPMQPRAALRGIKHEYQRWNNCGPTTLAMALNYFGRADTQAEIAAITKPNPDDRNVAPSELAAYATRAAQSMHARVRVNGTTDELKWLLSNEIPVIVETELITQPQGWMGHYRLLIGYDATQFNTLDSYQGANVKISEADLDAAWRAFNRLYIVIYSDEQAARVRAILGDADDDKTMYTQAVARATAEIEADQKDAFAQFNLGSSLVGLKRYTEAAAAFDRARQLGMPWRMMWYQTDPYEAYLRVGRYDEVIALADAALNRADMLEEAHYYKGLALRALKRENDARREFELALQFNKNFRDAANALAGK
ncbi:MAG: C39 family peptidase [Chloroflexi bacterium]|nr:C39 family peptidase [Chloroflexota bacterium]